MCLEHFKPKHCFKSNILHSWQVLCRGGGLCATSWKVAGSIFDGVFGIFHWHTRSGPTITLGSAQCLKEMSTRNISCMGQTTLPPSCGHCLEIWEPQLQGILRACTKIALLHFYRFHIRGDMKFIAARTSVCLSCMKQYCQHLLRTELSKYLILLWTKTA
jgi:hypothetical protein